MSGWVPMPVDSWPVIAEWIARPWPQEAVYYDLRWWADQARIGGEERPGRAALGRRWGWSDWRTRQALRDEEAWADLSKPTSPPPAHLQLASSPHPGAAREKLDNGEDSSSSPPASLQLASSSPPYARVETTVTVTDTDHTQSAAGGATGQQEVARAWEAYQVHHPRARTPSSTLRARVREHGVEAVLQVIEWAHTSSHTRAQYLRTNGYATATTLFRPGNFESYLEMATGANGHGAQAQAQACAADPRSILARVATGDLGWGDRWHDDDDLDRRAHECVRGLLPDLRGDQWQHRAAMQTAIERWERGA